MLTLKNTHVHPDHQLLRRVHGVCRLQLRDRAIRPIFRVGAWPRGLTRVVVLGLVIFYRGWHIYISTVTNQQFGHLIVSF